MNEIDLIIDRILIREGGYTNHTADRGGPTKFGITLKTLSEWRGEDVSATDVFNLKRAEAEKILRQRYVIQPNFHKVIDPELREMLIDTGVLHGPAWASRRLQEVTGVAVDGIIGPVTLRAVNFHGRLNGLPGRFLAARIRKYPRIVRRDPSQGVFLVGWIDRATKFLMK